MEWMTIELQVGDKMEYNSVALFNGTEMAW